MDPQMLVKLRSNLVKLENTGLFDNVDVHIRGNSQTEPHKLIYSRNDATGETSIDAFDRAQKVALKTTKRTFKERAEGIRETLSRFNENEKIEQLDKIEEEFKSLEDRGDYGE